MISTLPNRTAAASQELFDAICAAIADARGVHLETALAAAGYLAGAAMLRGSGVDLSWFDPGSAVLVDKLNEIGPMVLNTVFDLVHRGGVDPAEGMSKNVPCANVSLKTFSELLPMVQPAFDTVIAKYEIPAEIQPFVAARAAAQIILAGREQVPPAILKTVFAEAIVKATKTVSPRSA